MYTHCAELSSGGLAAAPTAQSTRLPRQLQELPSNGAPIQRWRGNDHGGLQARAALSGQDTEKSKTWPRHRVAFKEAAAARPQATCGAQATMATVH